MTREVRLYDPKDKPFGNLSNNYYQILEMGQEPQWLERLRKKGGGVPSNTTERWKSVTNFVYANLLSTPSYRRVVQGAPPANAQSEFSHLHEMELGTRVAVSLDEALEVLLENPKMNDLLVETGNFPILYTSSSLLLGVGDDGTGKNLLGKALELMRHKLLVSYKGEREKRGEEALTDKIYEGYLARRVLIHLMQNGDNLSKYMDVPVSEIAAMFPKVIEHAPAPKDVVMELYRNRSLHPSILANCDHPGIIVAALRKEGLRELQKAQESKRRVTVFDMYAEYIIDSKFPAIGRGDNHMERKRKRLLALTQQLTKVSFREQLNMQQKVYSLWKNGKMESNYSKNLSNSIGIALSSLRIPTDDEVEEAEALHLDYTLSEKTIDLSYRKTEGDPIFIYPDPNPGTSPNPKFVEFSPIYMHMLRINNMWYPTISHYLSAKLLASIPTIGNMTNAHKFLLASENPTPLNSLDAYVSPDDVWDRYAYQRDLHYSSAVRANAEEAMNHKFQNIEDQDVLMSTANARLVWFDRKDTILGVGPEGDGENFVGKHLMVIRDAIAESRKEEKKHVIDTSELTEVLENNAFLRGWLNLRLKDLCGVCKAMQNYSYRAHKQSLRMNAEFVSVVMDTIYQPCSQIAAYAKDVPSAAPDDFIRIAVLIYYLVKFSKESDSLNIRTALAQSAYIVSQKGKCVRIVSNDQDNCIISALTNIMVGIIAFNKKFGYNTEVQPQDVKTSVTILLNTDIEHEIKPALKKGEYSDITPVKNKGGRFEEDEDEIEGRIFEDEEEITAVGRESSDDEGEGDDYGGDEESENDDEGEFSPRMRRTQNTKQTFKPPGKKMLGVGPVPKQVAVQQRKGNTEPNEFIQVQKYLERTIPEVKDSENISRFIIGATEAVKTARMNKALKQNRINFFATVIQLQ
jgi:predicted NAD-dependent protein-ADP-ribosyltransferase YbiA (DUF1768 family)